MIVAAPACVHVNVGPADVASSNVPEVAVHWYESGAGPLSASDAVAASAIVPPTSTSWGLAATPPSVGQMLIVPVTDALPVVGACRQSTSTDTAVVWCAVTANVADPPHVVVPSEAVPVKVIVNSAPAGRSPTSPLTVAACETSSTPDVAKPPGPWIA